MSLTFLEAWRLRDKMCEEVRSVRAWLLGIATNVMRNTTRSARRHREAMSRLSLPETTPDFADEVVGQMADTQRLAAAARALQGSMRRENCATRNHIEVWRQRALPGAPDTRYEKTATVYLAGLHVAAILIW